MERKRKSNRIERWLREIGDSDRFAAPLDFADVTGLSRHSCLCDRCPLRSAAAATTTTTTTTAATPATLLLMSAAPPGDGANLERGCGPAVVSHVTVAPQVSSHEPPVRIVKQPTSDSLPTTGSSSSSGRRKKASSVADSGLRLKGQMKYMPAWDAIVFLGTPVLRDVESMYSVGLYINDLSMHDSSRDLILAGEQQSAELKLALEQEQEKSSKLSESMKRLDEEKKKTDELLYQMIPKTVADRLRRGDSAVDTCETFDEVTILFSDICGFTNICGAISPLDVVNMLNNMYSVFDKLTEQNSVYKVETVGDAYMIVSGAPVKTEHHAALMSEMAQDMVKAIAGCKDPSGINPHLRMRIGLHTGMVVAGVVGVKMPRYCLFGDTVNTANKMESSGQPQRIHISATTKARLDRYEAYQISDGSELAFPSKKALKTYFLDGKKDKAPQVQSLLKVLTVERSKLQDGMSYDQRSNESWQERAASSLSAGSVSSHRQHRQEIASIINGSGGH